MSGLESTYDTNVQYSVASVVIVTYVYHGALISLSFLLFQRRIYIIVMECGKDLGGEGEEMLLGMIR